MANREYIKIVSSTYILEEAHVDSVGDTVWYIYDPKKKNSFVVHSFENGKIYITFFKKGTISKDCSYDGLRKLCEILLSRGLSPSIVINPKNSALINLCRKVGFRKSRRLKNDYFFWSFKC